MIRYDIYDCLAERILLLDGGLGTMVQQYNLSEEDYRGEQFADHATALKGCNDILAITRPRTIGEIHEKYLAAGSDIITTDSFNANAVSLADYGLQEHVYDIARAAAEVARRAADAFTLRNPHKPRFVAGSVGPTNRTASMSARVEDPAAREVTFAQLKATYGDQIRGLLDGGADIILIETVFDTLNAKAALYAADEEAAARGRRFPIMVSGTLADAAGRTLSGQTVEAFAASVSHADLLSIGFNCAYGAKQMLPYLERLAAIAETRVSAYPNAGLPNLAGGYDETPEMFAEDVGEYMRRGLVNIVGGCCGTTPAHIAALACIVGNYSPRPVPERSHTLVLSGLEAMRVVPEANFINIGERTNVAGSAKFARLIREGNYEEALSVARAQIDAGAQLIDVCMDDGMIDAPQAMRHFLNLAAADPEIIRVPVMIDSSSWEVLRNGLEALQGKCIVNSISLKEGEEQFLARAAEIHRYGAAAVVMLFDEQGQAATFERKCEIAARAYRLLTQNGFPPEDIIFDPNILAVATGIPEHDSYGKAFIDATRHIKQNLPYVKVSGGVSNLSFAFRGNNPLREAMHTVFLYHASRAGMDMGIVNAAQLGSYDDIEPALRDLVEDVVLCRRADAAERLGEYARTMKSGDKTSGERSEQWRSEPLAERISYAMHKGIADYIEEDTLEACRGGLAPIEVIDSLLMPAMESVGHLFGEGKMFLPQVVKTARVMKRAVGVLTPLIDGEGKNKGAGRIVIATVKGDVHDIGKNIVAVVLTCNGFDVEDLGVMVERDRIIDEAVRLKADAICLSGLITPSLDEMMQVCKELERRGLRIPVVVGGATTSPLHTAVKIAPLYSGLVAHSTDASHNCRLLLAITGEERERTAERIRAEQESLRQRYAASREKRPLPLAVAREKSVVKRDVTPPLHTGRIVFPDFDIDDVTPYIDWTFFFTSWKLKGSYPAILQSPEYGEQARRLMDDAHQMLRRIASERLLRLEAAVGIFPAHREGDDIVTEGTRGERVVLPMLRNQQPEGENLSLADFIAPDGDHIGCFALTAGVGLRELCDGYRAAGDDYNAIMAKLLADRLAEAFAEVVHLFVRRQMWGYETGEPMSVEAVLRGEYRGVRMAFGYPATPDHALKRDVFSLLGVEHTTSMRLTDNYMITPEESLCGLILDDARYFAVGRISREQTEDYAARRGICAEDVERLIPNNI